jgi:hypothetical protein
MDGAEYFTAEGSINDDPKVSDEGCIDLGRNLRLPSPPEMVRRKGAAMGSLGLTYWEWIAGIYCSILVYYMVGQINAWDGKHGTIETKN